MNNEQIVKSLQEAQIAFRQLSHLPDARELCQAQDAKLTEALKGMKP